MTALSRLGTYATPIVTYRRDAAPAEPPAVQNTGIAPPAASTRVTLGHTISSPLGQTGRTSGNDDIDDSDLPDNIKAILRQMRAIQAQLRQAMEELRQAQADSQLTPEQRRLRVQAVQSHITALLGAQSELNAQLLKRLRVQPLSTEQQYTLGKLVMKT